MSRHEENRIEGVLVLEDHELPEGREFPGYLFGAPVSAELLRRGEDRGYGEVVFNTSMTGYQEILTDPSYFGQIICMTVPHVGNTGVNEEDPESGKPWCAGFIVHEFSDSPSSWRSEESLDGYLKKHGVPGLYDVDTRALTRHLRKLGVVRGVILPRSERALARELLAKLPPFEGRDLISEVTTQEPYRWPRGVTKVESEKARFKVVALDFGVKRNMLRILEKLGCAVEVLPASTKAEEILARAPDGVFLSNGPGDPSAAPYATETVRDLVGKVPIFGVCMGHQILSLAMGGKTFKLKFGHRGANQPVYDRTVEKVEISSQNHGYAVDAESMPQTVEITHLNLNDKTVAGLRVKDSDAFSVQYHPEACPGPHDSLELFNRFVESMQARQGTKQGTGSHVSEVS